MTKKEKAIITIALLALVYVVLALAVGIWGWVIFLTTGIEKDKTALTVIGSLDIFMFVLYILVKVSSTKEQGDGLDFIFLIIGKVMLIIWFIALGLCWGPITEKYQEGWIITYTVLLSFNTVLGLGIIITHKIINEQP